MPAKAKKETDSEEEKKEEQEGKDEEKKITDLPGIGPGTAKKLEDAGVYDLMGLVVMSPKNLADLTGMSEAVSRKAIQAGRKMMDLGFVDGMEYSQKMNKTGKNLIKAMTFYFITALFAIIALFTLSSVVIGGF